MTVTRNQRNNYETSEMQPSLSGSSEKMQALRTCLAHLGNGKELTEDEIKQWREFLDRTPGWLASRAFKEWTRKNNFFPKPAQILELVDAYKGQNMVKFEPCEKDGCMDGWVRVFEGTTAGGHPVDSKVGAVVRCACWHVWSGR